MFRETFHPHIYSTFCFFQDIVDTGNTMVKLISTLQKYKPAQIKVARYGMFFLLTFVAKHLFIETG